MLFLATLIVALVFPPWAKERPILSSRVHVAGWTLYRYQDRFSERVVCRLSRDGVTYERHAIVLHFPAQTDTSEAVYRIDGGPPIAAVTDAMELASSGFQLRDDDLRNPSQGLLRIPERRLAGAQLVNVETSPAFAIATFKLDGLGPALAAARAAGCEAFTA
jgi:hypothetical protein